MCLQERNPTPTINQLTNQKPTLGQRIHAIWDISVFYNALFGKISLMIVQYPNQAYVSHHLFNPILKWRIHLSRSQFLYFNHLASVIAGET